MIFTVLPISTCTFLKDFTEQLRLYSVAYPNVHRLASSDRAYSAEIVVAQFRDKTLSRPTDIKHILTHHLQQRDDVLDKEPIIGAGTSNKAEGPGLGSMYTARNGDIIKVRAGRLARDCFAHFDGGSWINCRAIDKALAIDRTGQNSTLLVQKYVSGVAAFVNNGEGDILDHGGNSNKISGFLIQPM